MARLTIAAVNKALAARGSKDELVKGNGYFYFWGDTAITWYCSSVYVCKLNHIPTVEGWLRQYDMLEAENRKHRGIR
jgi:hypothetical protein